MSESSPKADPKNTSYEKHAEVLSELRKTIEYRELYLRAFEKLMIEKVLSQQITMLNLGSLRKLGLRSIRESAMLNVEIKILRRSIFFLRERERQMLMQIENLKLKPEIAESSIPSDESVQSDTEAIQKVG